MTQLEAHTDGSYTGFVHLDTAGAWQISVHFSDQGHDRAATFNVAVAESNSNGLILGGFAGVNALIIGAAAMLKRRSPAALKQKRASTVA